LSDRALPILADIARTTKRPPTADRYVFASPLPRQPLSAMAMLLLLRRLKVDVTTHGFRSSARSWVSNQAVEFEIAEASLSHRRAR
jgi:hypothetical protein